MAKRKPDPSWFHWSDGRPFSKDERRKMRFTLKRSKQDGESFRQRFERVRATVERYEQARAKIRERKPGLVARALGWLRGRSPGVRLELKG